MPIVIASIVAGLCLASTSRTASVRQPNRVTTARADGPTAVMEQRAGLPPTAEQLAAAEEQLASWMEPATQSKLPAEAFELRSTEDKGTGLFAMQRIERGTFLFNYEGVALLDSDYDGLSDYAIGVENSLGVEYVLDAADPATSGLARYLNHAPSDGPGCNVAILRGSYKTWPGPDPPALHMFSRRDIEEGEELCFDCKLRSNPVNPSPKSIPQMTRFSVRS